MAEQSEVFKPEKNFSELRVIIIPGMGCTPTKQCNWYGWLHNQLLANGVTSIAEDFPDPYKCRESICTGSEAILRYLEKYRVRGAVIVSAYHTDLGDNNERLSGYFNRPWDWDVIRSNAGWLVQYHSVDDPLVPVDEARFVAQMTKNQYIEFKKRDHFMQDRFPELLDLLLQKIAESSSPQNHVSEKF